MIDERARDLTGDERRTEVEALRLVALCGAAGRRTAPRSRPLRRRRGGGGCGRCAITAETMAASPSLVARSRDERAVDLHRVDREALQVIQRRVAGAEVVDRDARRRSRAARAGPPRVSSAFCIAVVSVISSSSTRRVESGRRRAMRRTSSTRSCCWNWRGREVDGDAQRRRGRRRATARICVQAVRSTHSPIGRISRLSSASGMNAERLDEAALRIVPAHQRLDADDLSRGEVDLRLVVQDQLLVCDRAGAAASRATAAPAARVFISSVQSW